MTVSSVFVGQGRLDGAVCEHTEEEKMDFLRRAEKAGVVNIEMECAAMASLCNKVRGGREERRGRGRERERGSNSIALYMYNHVYSTLHAKKTKEGRKEQKRCRLKRGALTTKTCTCLHFSNLIFM